MSLRYPNGNKNRFGSFLGHPCRLRSRGIFCFSYACLISILNIFYDGEINTYIHPQRHVGITGKAQSQCTIPVDINDQYN